MKYGKVIGSYISSLQSDGLTQGKLLLVQPLEFDNSSAGAPFIAVDSVGSGAGEYIIWVGGMEATFPFEDRMIPVDACIIGIVDKVSLHALCDECGLLKCPRSVEASGKCIQDGGRT